MRAQPNRLEDKRYLNNLIDNLEISKGRLKVDECGDWVIPTKAGVISTDSENWYLYLRGTGIRQWNNLKRRLKFMVVHQDGEDEGILKLKEELTKKQAEEIRKVLKLRKSTKLSEDDRESLKIRLRTPSS